MDQHAGAAAMKQRGLFRVAQGAPPALLPEDLKAKQIINELGQGKRALVSVHTARYPEHNGLVFMVLQKIADATNTELRNVILSLLYETGRFDYIQLLDKTVVPDPQSLSPESMTQEEFSKFWEEAKTVINEKWIKLMSVNAYKEIVKLMEPKQ
jgi:hypothetical protein